jgi:hypothetical protein
VVKKGLKKVWRIEKGFIPLQSQKERGKILRVCCGKKRFKKSLENRERVYTFAVPKREGEDFKGLLW